MEPKASWMCPTYRRPSLLCELLYCFLGQDWENKELVVLNDEPGQELVCEHPQVRIVNWPRKITHLGIKRNLGVSMCEGDYIFHIDDDDLYLPHKTRQAIENASPMGVFKTDLLIVDADPLEMVHGRLPGNVMYTHRSFAMTCGYGLRSKIYDDPQMMFFLDAFMDHLGDKCRKITEPSYIYRAYTTPYHVSRLLACPPYPHDGEIERGRIVIEPKKPDIDINAVEPVYKGRRLSDLRGMHQPANLETFMKGIGK